MPGTSKHILVIRLSAMGDVAMTVPVIRAFTQQYPNIKLTVLTKPLFKPFFREFKNVTIVSAEVKGKHKGLSGLYKLARQLNKNNFFAIADLHNVLRSKILRRLISCNRLASIDKGRAEKKALTTGKVFKPLKTTHRRYADVFEQLGFPVDLSNPPFPEKIKLSDTLKNMMGNPQQKTIGIAPFATYEGKMYPFDLMKQVIETLSEEYNVILFGGGEKEIQILTQIERQFKNVTNVAGKLMLNEELDVISNLDVMLSMDSGNAHMAAMLGVKTITVWGVTHPYAGFTPFNQPEGYALLPDRKQFPEIPTSVYGNKYPEDYKEVSGSIAPETIIEKIKAVI